LDLGESTLLEYVPQLLHRNKYSTNVRGSWLIPHAYDSNTQLEYGGLLGGSSSGNDVLISCFVSV